MATEFSIGVIIGGAISGAFRSAISGTRRTLDSIGETTRRLQERQTRLTRAVEQYGGLGSSSVQRLNTSLQRVGRTMEQLERQQKRLSAASAMSSAARTNRMALYGQGAETVAMATTLLTPVVKAVTQYSRFESGLRDVSVTGNLKPEEENRIGGAVRRSALQNNQLWESVLTGVNQLVADGMEANRAGQMSGVLGRAATATKADMQDLAKMTFAFSDSLKLVSPKEIEEAFAMAAAGAKTGSFEMKDMAKAIPGMAKAFAARGITGKEALTQIIASLEAAKGAGSSEEAVTNMNNWLAAMGRGETIKRYEKAGIDYQGSMSSFVAAGYSQYEASLMIANKFIDKKGKAFVAQWEAAGKTGDTAAQQKLFESFGMAEVFTDMQTVNHLISMRQNWDKYLSNKKTMNSPDVQNTLGTDFEKNNATLEARWRRIRVGVADIALSVGTALRPALMSWSEAIIPLLDSAGKWIAANPEIVTSVAKVALGLLAFSMTTVGVKLGCNLLFSGFVNVWKGAVLLHSRWVLLRAAFSRGGFMYRLATGAARLAKVMGVGLYRGIMVAARAILFIGRALLLNPIGLAITAVAVAAYLIYRNWGAISKWFKQRWADIKEAFNGGIVGIGKLLINWSPVGLLYKAFAAALKYLGVDLPAKFTDFGGYLIDGLVNGLKNKWESLKNAVSGMGDSISGWFKEKLDINSPSRVFMGFGRNIAEGATMGLQKATPMAALAGQRLASEMTPEVPRLPAPEIMHAGYSGRPELAAGGGAPGIQVSFNPQFFLGGKETPTPAVFSGALNMSLHELEKMMERILVQHQRREYK